MNAVRYNENLEVSELLITEGADFKTRDIYGNTSLMYAAGENDNPEIIKIVKLLLDEGANVNASSENGSTPLMIASGWNNNPEVIQKLIDAVPNCSL